MNNEMKKTNGEVQSKSETAPAKKKMHLVFHPEHSTKPLPQRKKPAKEETAPAKKPETKPQAAAEAPKTKPQTETAEKKPVQAASAAPAAAEAPKLQTAPASKPQTVDKQEKANTSREKRDQEALNMQSPEKKTGDTAGSARQGERSQSRRENGQGGYRRDGQEGGQRREGGPRRDGQEGGYRRDGQGGGYRRDGQNGGYQRRDGQENGYQRRDGQNGGYQRRDGQGGGFQRRDGQEGGYQRRDGQEGGYQRRDGQNGGYQRRDGQEGGYQRRDGQNGGYQRRDGQNGGFQRRDGQEGGYQRRDGQGGGFQRRDGQGGGFQRKDGDFGNRRSGDNKDRGSRSFGGGSDTMSPALTKNEARGGKGLNKKERELREKSKQNTEKNGRFSENTKNMNKAKNAPKKPQEPVVEKQEDDGIKTMILPEVITVGELADKMKMTAAALIKAMFMKGKMFNINSDLTYEQAEEIALDYNYICEPEEKVDVIAELLKEDEENEADMVPRPPVVCVMGHVDHGKTSLLDAIRSTNVTEREAGGITQHIGAYTVKCKGQDITFLDTPGHEAFTAMRMRGAQATDIAVLVVAADDGVMPQTVEAINHAKAAGVDIIVAVNKIDKPSANVERVMKELSEHELIPEDWGGQTIFVPVSAKTHEGIENLLEMILLDAEMKELKANPNRKARGLVIEAQLDKGRGPVATILVQKGTLHVGDNIAVGSCFGKVRAMIDDKGRRVKEAKPSTPVEILGLNEVPNAGEVLVSTASEKEARSFAETFIKENREKMLADTKTKLTLDSLNSQIHEGTLKELNIIIKADVQGSVEAVKQSLLKLSNEEVVVRVIHSGVGAINESDVTLASASNAIIIGFNVRPDPLAKSISEREKVEIRLYRVIYQAIADVEAAMKGMLDPIFEEKIIGHAQVRQIFKASGVGNIAGCYVMDGSFQRGCKIRIRRAGEQVYEGALASLKRMKDDVKEVKEGFECGMLFEKFNDIMVDDEIEAYIMVEVPR